MSSDASNQEWFAAEQVKTAWRSAYQSRQLSELMTEPNKEAIKAAFRALESVEEFVSPEMARSIQATINLTREIGRDYGLLSEETVRAELDLSFRDKLPRLFSVTYRDQKLFPAFLFELAPGEANKRRVKPVIAELGKLADEYGWDQSSVVHWLVSPTTWFAPGDSPVDHLDETSRILTAFKDSAGVEW